MEATEISLLILRHLARDGCLETIRTYLQECPSMRQSLSGRGNGAPDVELYRNKLLGCSVNLTLMDLLTDYGRAKAMIQDLVGKVVNDWKAVSGLYLSPHDSMATQLAHITKLLESKYNRCMTSTKNVGTSDDEVFNAMHLLNTTPSPKETADACNQVNEECWTALREEPPKIGTKLVTSLFNPPVVEKIVELANNEMNKSNNSAENTRHNDTESQIDQVLLEILNGFGGNSMSNNNLGNDCGSRDNVTSFEVESQLNSLFNEAQNVIVDTPISGTLGRPEDSAMKRPCSAFLDLIETPYKQSFVSTSSTPLTKQPPELAEKTNLKAVELNFGIAVDPTTIFVPVTDIVVTKPSTQCQQNVPRFSVVTNPQKDAETLQIEMNRLKRRRNLMPKVPQNRSQASISSSEAGELRKTGIMGSASKRKFSTPVKWTPSKGTGSHLSFFCPTNSTHKDGSNALRSSALDRTIEPPSPPKAMETSSINTPCKDPEPDPVPVVSSTPLPTINYEDIRITEEVRVEAPKETEKPSAPIVDMRSFASPDFSNADFSLQPGANYNRLLASVRHNRPTVPLAQKKSFSTPRKKGHIRNLLFKTPPSGQEKSSFCFDSFSTSFKAEKRKTSPALGSKSKKRLKWTMMTPTTEVSVESSQILVDITSTSPPGTSPVKVMEPAEIPKSPEVVLSAITVTGGSAVTTRSRAANRRKNVQQITPLATSNDSLSKLSPKVTPSPQKSGENKTKGSPMTRTRRAKQTEQLAAEAAAAGAVPLGTRSTVTAPFQRVTRGQKALHSQKLPQTTVHGANLASPAAHPTSIIGFSRTEMMTPSGQSSHMQNIPTQSFNLAHHSSTNISSSNNTSSDSSFGNTFQSRTSTSSVLFHGNLQPAVSVSTRHSQRKAAHSGVLLPEKNDNIYVTPENDKFRAMGHRPAVETPITISIPENPASGAHDNSLINSLFGYISESDTGKSTDDSDTSPESNSSTKVGVTRSSKTWTMKIRSPIKTKPTSPRKFVSQGKTPRRILPQPVPSSYPVPVFPPTPDNQGYTLSIPSNTPRKGPVEDLIVVSQSQSIISPIVVGSSSPDKLPKISSDSSSDFSVPKTPRVKLISEETSMHSRLFPPDSLKTGAPIFSSTPLKTGVPETPGKNITALNPAANEENSHSSLFDTPMKMDDVINFSTVARSKKRSSVDTKSKSTLKVDKLPPVRKSPRKLGNSQPISETKTKSKRGSKPSLPTGPIEQSTELSTGKAASKTNITRATPLIPAEKPSSSSSKKEKNQNQPPLKEKSATTASKKDKNKASQQHVAEKPVDAPPSKQVENLTHALPTMEKQELTSTEKNKEKLASVFPNWFSISKTRNMMILSQAAKKEKASMSTGNISIEAIPQTEPSNQNPSAGSLPTKQKESTEQKDLEVQFAVAGRTKKLSLSEHESLLGLLQIGSTKTPQKKQPHMPLKDTQVPTANILQTVDVQKFLMSIHARE